MSRLRALWSRLLDSLWFVPATIVLLAVALAVGMVELSTLVDRETLARWPRVFGAGADGSRSMLSGIATSMITVAGVTFSITMVAVTQASTQYTPRILRNFMRDRANQVVLGSFVGIFAYCIVVLRTIRGGSEGAFVPSLAVLGGVLLAIAGIAVLIFFVHHIASTLEASEIIARVTHDTLDAVDRLFPDPLDADHPPPRAPEMAPRVARRPVTSDVLGYVESIDLRRLVQAARDCGVVIRLEHTVGDFVAGGRPRAWVAPDGRPAREGHPDDSLAEAARAVEREFVVGNYRIIDRDPAFGIRQLVDIALKALSPGINDTTTAVTCVHYLGAIVQRLACRRIDTVHRDEDGVARVLAPEPTFETLLGAAYDEIRRNATGNVSVLAAQLEALAAAARVAPTAERRHAVHHQAGLVHRAGSDVREPHDRERLDALAAGVQG